MQNVETKLGSTCLVKVTFPLCWYLHVQLCVLEFHTTYTLCALSTVSGQCYDYYTAVVGISIIVSVVVDKTAQSPASAHIQVHSILAGNILSDIQTWKATVDMVCKTRKALNRHFGPLLKLTPAVHTAHKVIKSLLAYLIWAGVVPQHPPAMLTRPSSAKDWRREWTVHTSF